MTKATGSGVEALRTWPVQVAALAMIVIIGSMSAATNLPDGYRVGYGVGIMMVAVIASTLVLVWRRAARGFIPVLALVLAAPLAMATAPGGTPGGFYVPASASGEWQGEDDLRTYRFVLQEEPNGDIVGRVEYGRPGEPRERFGVTGSRLGSGISIWFEQTDHAPWVLNGQFVDEGTIRAHLSVGDMILMPIAIRRGRE